MGEGDDVLGMRMDGGCECDYYNHVEYEVLV